MSGEHEEDDAVLLAPVHSLPGHMAFVAIDDQQPPVGLTVVPHAAGSLGLLIEELEVLQPRGLGLPAPTEVILRVLVADQLSTLWQALVGGTTAEGEAREDPLVVLRLGQQREGWEPISDKLPLVVLVAAPGGADYSHQSTVIWGHALSLLLLLLDEHFLL